MQNLTAKATILETFKIDNTILRAVYSLETIAEPEINQYGGNCYLHDMTIRESEVTVPQHQVIRAQQDYATHYRHNHQLGVLHGKV